MQQPNVVVEFLVLVVSGVVATLIAHWILRR